MHITVTVHGKILVGESNCELFAKIFLVNIHRYTKMYLAYALTVACTKFFLASSFNTCMVRQNLPVYVKHSYILYCSDKENLPDFTWSVQLFHTAKSAKVFHTLWLSIRLSLPMSIRLPLHNIMHTF